MDSMFEGETRPLLQIQKAFLKVVHAGTREAECLYGGIHVVGMAGWLVEEAYAFHV